MGGVLDKDGIGTQIIEFIPGGGLITAPIHALAGNHGHAVAAVAGVALNIVLPGAGGAVTKGVLHGVIKGSVKTAAVVAVAKAGGKRALARAAANSVGTYVAKHGIKKTANAIKKCQQ